MNEVGLLYYEDAVFCSARPVEPTVKAHQNPVTLLLADIRTPLDERNRPKCQCQIFYLEWRSRLAVMVSYKHVRLACKDV